MSFAVQLYFDAASDTAIRRFWEDLANAGVPFPLRDSGNHPHISLALYEEVNVPLCASRLTSYAQTVSPFSLSIASVGIFAGEKTVVFLAPAASSGLLYVHRQVHQLLQDTTAFPKEYYLPGHWTPHCTLATRVPPHFLSQAVAIGLGVSFPLTLSIEEMGIITYPPVARLFSCRFTGA